MWLNCFMVVFLSSNNFVSLFQFEDGDTDPKGDWDSIGSFIPNTDDDDGDGLMPQIKAGASYSNPVRVNSGLSDSKPVHPRILPESVIPASGDSYSNPEWEWDSIESLPLNADDDDGDDDDDDDGFMPQVKTGLLDSKVHPRILPGSVRIPASGDTESDPEVDWDSKDKSTLTDDDDDDDGNGFLAQFKAGLSDSKPVHPRILPGSVRIPASGDTKSYPEGGWDSKDKSTLTDDDGDGGDDDDGGGDDDDDGGDDDGGDDDDGLMPRVKSGKSDSKPVPLLRLPGSVGIPASMLHKELFTPEKGGRPMPPLVKSILLAETRPKKPVSSAPKMVEVMCHLDRIHVRVQKSMFAEPSAWKHLKLGTCPVNKVSAAHYHLLYYLKGCGIKREEDADRVTYSNTLHYTPAATGLIVRQLPFTVHIRCTYTKFHRSYATGFLPHIAGGILYKDLQSRTGPTLTAMDASWNSLPVGHSFEIGKPICFEAKGASRGTRNRLYMNSCFVTSFPSPWLVDKYYVVENYGCLVDSKHSALTKFYTSANQMTLRMCVAAFLFKNMVSQPLSKKTMYMHCELAIGPETPTPSAKSCMYNSQTKKWTELYGVASVCNCCDSTCPVSPRASGKKMITSESWDLKMEKESTPSPEEHKLDFSLVGNDFELFWETDD